MKITKVTIASQADDLKESKVEDSLYEKPETILTIDEPTDKQKQIALSEMPKLIAKLKSPTEQDYLYAVRADGNVLQFIPNRSKRVIEEAVRTTGDAIRFVENPTEDQIRIALISNPFSIRHIKNKELWVQQLAVRTDGLAIQHIQNPEESVQILAVKTHPSALGFISNPTKKVCETALRVDGLAIEHVKAPSEELQLLAVSESYMAYAYRYIDKPTDKVKIIAYKKNPNLIAYMDRIPEEIQINAVNKDIRNFQYIEEPTKKCQKLVLKHIVDYPHIFDDIHNIDQDVLTEYLEEIKFTEKYDKRQQIPEGLNLPQLRLYRYFQQMSKKEVFKTELKNLDFIDNRIRKIMESIKGNVLKLSDVISFKPKKTDSELGTFIQKKFGLAKLNATKQIFDSDSMYFVVYVDAVKLLDLDFNKNHIYNMSQMLADKEPPYIPGQYILGYVKYTPYLQNIWIDEFWTDTKIKSSEDNLNWLPAWIMSLFIRELRYRDYNSFYYAIPELRSRLKYPESPVYMEQLLQAAYFRKMLIKNLHPLVNGKEAFILT
jgi:hypothetical protein